MIEKVINDYLALTYGSMIDDTDTLNNIKKIAYYLLDNKYNDSDILKYLITNNTELVDSLWNDSLLKPDTFYYHEQLTIMPGPSVWNPNMKEESSKFYLEMKIKYTINDLLSYYYNNLLIPVELRNTKKDGKAFEHMLKQYNKFKMQPIDFVLYLIDYNAFEGNRISDVFDLQKYEREVYDKTNYIIENTINKNIIWRGLTV